MTIDNDIKKASNRLENYVEKGTYLITGSTGMMGRYLVRVLSNIGDVKIIAGCRSKEKAELLFHDLIKKKKVSVRFFDACSEKWEIEDSVDYLLHAAGVCENDYLLRYPQNVIINHTVGAYMALEFANRKNIKRVVIFSSAAVYGKVSCEAKRLNERKIGYIDFLDYKNAYGISKRTVENLCAAFQEKLNITIIRPFHMISPEQLLVKSSMIGDFYHKTVNGENIIISGSGESLRNFTYIVDMCEMILLIMQANPGVYNLGNEDGDVSVAQMAEMIKGVYGEICGVAENVRIIVGNEFKKPSNSLHMIPELSKTKKELFKNRYEIKYISPRTALEKSMINIRENNGLNN